jgi:type I restriction enzyme S subunit
MTELPQGWGLRSVGAVAAVDSGPAFQSKHFGGPGDGTRLLRGDNIEPGRLRWARTRTWPDVLMPGSEPMLVATGDIILAMDRPVVSAGLKLARVSATDLPALLVQRVARIRPHDVEARYLYHLLESQAFIDHMRASEVGTQVPHVTLKGIREFSVPLPTRDEQRRIVDILEDHLSRLDAAVDGLATAQRRSHSLGAVTLESLAPTDTPVRTLGRSYDGLEG